jgi:RNA polymerase sigma factor (TIGR02999 family)
MLGTMSRNVTLMLNAFDSGDPKAAVDLRSAIYDELRQLAGAHMASEREGHTLQPTALVHEAWLRLGGDQQGPWENRAHFFGAAGEAMRRILVDHARRRLAAKRGGGAEHLALDEVDVPSPSPTVNDEDLLRIHEVLDKLAEVDARKAELVKLRYFVGMNYKEAAAALGIAVPTAKQWWAYTRAWLTVELSEEKTDSVKQEDQVS